jgi:hypothetical protein
MRMIVFAMVASAGMLFVPSLEASATPADGATIAGIGQQVDPVINAKTRFCPADQTRRNKYGYCRPSRSQY